MARSYGELVVLNVWYHIFHLAIIVANHAWLLPARTPLRAPWSVRSLLARPRFWSLLCLLATIGSWVYFERRYHSLYCFVTEWHWNVKEQLGYTRAQLPPSYSEFLLARALHNLGVIDASAYTPSPLHELGVSSEAISLLTEVTFLVCLVGALYVNIRDIVAATSPSTRKKKGA